jgi:hypothetical protein
MIIRIGSFWQDKNNNKFVVLNEVVIEGYSWIHYRDALGNPPNEHSCYRTSFLEQFTEVV